MSKRQDLTPEEEAVLVEREVRGEAEDAVGDQPTLEEMRSELRGWGIWLIVIGVAQYFIPFLVWISV